MLDFFIIVLLLECFLKFFEINIICLCGVILIKYFFVLWDL